MSNSRRWVARAALVSALAAPAALVAASPAFAIQGGVDPIANPPVYPGTTTPVDAWKLSGAGFATHVQVAPRWLVSSKHAGLTTGQIYRSPLGETSRVAAYYEVVQQVIGNNKADMSISLLETPIAAPADGFPYLLTEGLTEDLLGTLPGYVFWAGQATTTNSPVPTVGWTRANGLGSIGPALSWAGGDSGSGGLLYPKAGARPIYAGSTRFGGPVYFGADTRVAEKLMPGDDENFPTIEAWMRAKLALHPEAAPPSFSDFAGAGVDFAKLLPAAPRNIRAIAATPTSVTLGWDAPIEPRLERTGYVVRVAPSGRTFSVPATATSLTVPALSLGTTYQFTVKAQNANGESPAAARSEQPTSGPQFMGVEPDTFGYLMRESPGALKGFSVTAGPSSTSAGGSVRLDYCLTAEWAPPNEVSGSPVTRYETALNGVVVPNPEGMENGLTPRLDGNYLARVCGLEPGSVNNLSVRAVSDVTLGPLASASRTVPAGAPRGTLIGAPSAVASVTRRSTRLGKVDYCATTTWEAPVALDGAPVTEYEVVVRTASSFTSRFVSASARSVLTCGLRPATSHRVVVRSWYRGVSASEGGVSTETSILGVTTPTGPPNGTPLPGPELVSVTPRLAKDAAGNVDYCADVMWTTPAVVEGFPMVDSDLLLASSDLSSLRSLDAQPVTSGSLTRSVCGLKPATTYSTSVSTRFQVNDTMTARTFSESLEAVTPAGAAPGAVWPSPQSIAATVITVGTQLCADISWVMPSLPVGMTAPISSVLTVGGGGFLDGSEDLPSTARTYRVCGLPRGRSVNSTVYASFGDMVTTKGRVAFTTPA